MQKYYYMFNILGKIVLIEIPKQKLINKVNNAQKGLGLIIWIPEYGCYIC